MFQINDNFAKLPASYLFSKIAHMVEEYRAAHPEADIIRMGIGDVTLPLCPAVISAMHTAVDDEASAKSFHGYGPEQGYAFLREAIAQQDYHARNIHIDADEIFVGDGAKSDVANICDLFGPQNRIALTDPVYPVYLDSNVIAGRAGTYDAATDRWSRIIYLPVNAANGFVPSLPSEPSDIIYLCYPNNPTGTALTRQQLQPFVDYALEHGSLIMYDSAYEAYITQNDVPHSIYELPGARLVAIEFRSFSKTAGFTGIRCGYTVVPRDITAKTTDGAEVNLNQMWKRRQTTKFNGASYISQRGAAAIYTPEGHAQAMANVAYYMANANLMLHAFQKMHLEVFGGVNAPYVWVKTPDGIPSWEFFGQLLERCQVVTTPGVGFGPSGEGYIRLTAFNTRENTMKAMERISRQL